MQAKQLSIAAIITAAGSSSRMGGPKKEYLSLPSVSSEKPMTVLAAALAAFASCAQIGPIVITVPPGGEKTARACLPAELLAGGERIFFVQGGPSRRISVHNALSFLEAHHPSHVLIHDGARPWIKQGLIERCIEGVIRHGALIPALPLLETPKELYSSENDAGAIGSNEPAFIKRHLRRENLCGAQTPQAFRFPEILKAHEKAAEREARENFEYTDDAEVWGEFIGRVAAIPGDSENRKITYAEDLRGRGEWGVGSREERLVMRIGLGRDIHRLEAGRRFLLGGVEIPFDKGELGHSDGDVLAHAICDALLGAAALGDIGELYPDNDPLWENADSIGLLKGAWHRVRAQGWRLANLDCTVICERPKILPHRENIRRSLAEALEVEAGAVFVKGKSNEGLGPEGSGEAVEALAVCLLEKCIQ